MTKMYKFVMDYIIAIVSIIVFSPILILLIIVIFIHFGRPLVFKQLRPGLNGKPFNLYKFRTMNNLKDLNGNLLPDSERLDRFGTFLRTTSLDELPSLFNVLKAEVSIVGPRPLLMEYLDLYTENQLRRHEVKPGITGWAQVNGRNAISWEEKFRLDVWYVDNQSFWLDIKIILLTIKKVFLRDGVSAEGEATMPKFTGNSTQ